MNSHTSPTPSPHITQRTFVKPSSIPAQRTSNMRLQKSYPIFKDCLEYANDDFWKLVFENLSNGKTPYGVFINDNTIYSNYKKRGFSYHYNDKTSETIFNELKHILINTFGLRTDKDLKLRTNNLQKIRKELDVQNKKSWKSIKKKSLKEQLLFNYIMLFKNTHSLTHIETRNLLNKIQVMMLFKQITPDDINCKDGKIISIDNIEFDENENTFNLTHIQTNNDKIETPVKKKIMFDKWIKHTQLSNNE